MKQLLLICVMLVLGISLHAQQAYQTLSVDTVKGAQTKYFTATADVKYVGVATFDFTAKGFGTSDSCYFTLEGKNQGTTWLPVSGQTAKHGGTVAKDYQLIANPVTFINYRLKVLGKASDTCRISQPLFIYKK